MDIVKIRTVEVNPAFDRGYPEGLNPSCDLPDSLDVYRGVSEPFYVKTSVADPGMYSSAQIKIRFEAEIFILAEL